MSPRVVYIVRTRSLSDQELGKLALLVASAVSLSYDLRRDVVVKVLADFDAGRSCLVLTLDASRLRGFYPDCSTAAGLMRMALKRGTVKGITTTLKHVPCDDVKHELLSECPKVVDLSASSLLQICDMWSAEGRSGLCVHLDLYAEAEVYPGGPRLKPWWAPCVVNAIDVFCSMVRGETHDSQRTPRPSI